MCYLILNQINIGRYKFVTSEKFLCLFSTYFPHILFGIIGNAEKFKNSICHVVHILGIEEEAVHAVFHHQRIVAHAAGQADAARADGLGKGVGEAFIDARCNRSTPAGTG